MVANKKLSEGVGKKIVEALKQQSEIEITPISSNEVEETELIETFGNDNLDIDDIFEEHQLTEEVHNDDLSSFADSESSSFLNEDIPLPQVKPSFTSTPVQPNIANESFIRELDGFEIPNNIAVLKKLITQLPSGVTKHTGAQIIKQTMEALGISMKSVLQEAQQVQDGLNNSARECQSTIQEYKKQITLLEKQSQNHQRQYNALNELISLFIQTGI